MNPATLGRLYLQPWYVI